MALPSSRPTRGFSSGVSLPATTPSSAFGSVCTFPPKPPGIWLARHKLVFLRMASQQDCPGAGFSTLPASPPLASEPWHVLRGAQLWLLSNEPAMSQGDGASSISLIHESQE